MMGYESSDGCPECESDKTDDAKAGDGRIGVYCWDCETLYVDPEIVYGDVEVLP